MNQVIVIDTPPVGAAPEDSTLFQVNDNASTPLVPAVNGEIIVETPPVARTPVCGPDEDLTRFLQGPQGPQGSTGPTGSQGPPGPSGGSYFHTQSLASSVWLVQHNLGFRPGGFVVTTSDDEDVEPVIKHMNDNVTMLTFWAPTSGTATVS